MPSTSSWPICSKFAVTVHGLDGDWSIFRREIVFVQKNVGRKHGSVPFRGALSPRVQPRQQIGDHLVPLGLAEDLVVEAG